MNRKERDLWNTPAHFEDWCLETIELCTKHLGVNPANIKQFRERILHAYHARLYPRETIFYLAETFNLHMPSYIPPSYKGTSEKVMVAIFVGTTYITTKEIEEDKICELSDKIRAHVPKGMQIKLTVVSDNGTKTEGEKK